MTPRKTMPVPPPESTRRYFIVNPAGCIHEVDRAHAKWRLGFAGWRMATRDEVALLDAGRPGLSPGEQRHDFPICAPWFPDPDAELDPDRE